jgi:cytochrome c2
LPIAPLLSAAIVASAQARGDSAHGKTLFGRCAKPHGTTAQNKFGLAMAGVFGHLAGTVENGWPRPKHSDLSFNQINKLTRENGK